MKNRFLSFVCSVAALFAATGILPAAEPKVAILVESEFPSFGPAVVPPARTGALLTEYGIASTNITVEQLSNPSFFNTDRFTVLVLTYGNTFPLEGQKSLKKFLANGGCLVVNNLPFSRPAERTKDGWNDPEHTVYFMHDEKGFGTGNHRGASKGFVEQRIAPKSPFDLPADVLAGAKEQLPYLDASSLPAEDTIIPLIETKTATGWAPACAIIKHNCKPFKESMTLWLGQPAKQPQQADGYYLKNVLVRGIGYILRTKNEMSPGQYARLNEKMSELKKPAPLPDQLTATFPPRPWGDTFLPKSKKPAEHLYAVDMDKLKSDEKIALSTLQGLTSRREPCIWLSFRGDNGPFWLNWHKEKGYIKSYEMVADWTQLFKKFSADFEGAVIPDDTMYRGVLIAANVASCENLIVVPEALAKKLHIPVKIDLRGRFKTYPEAMRWVWKTYKDQLNHNVCDLLSPKQFQHGSIAYDIQWKNPIIWISGPTDGILPGADPLEEAAVVADIISAMPAGTAFLGFPFAGEGVGIGETGGTRFMGGYGKSLVCTDYLSNLPITSGVTIEKFVQPPQPPLPPLEKDKIYVALVFSDGDNQNIWRSFFKRIVNEPDYGKFPISFGMGPAIWDLQPAIAQWFYENATVSEFISDVSGIGYMQPANYGSRFVNRDEVLKNFVDWTRIYLEKMDMKSIRTVGGGNDAILPYIKGIPAMHSVFADMGRYSGFSGYKNLTYTLEGMPVFRAQDTWDDGAEGVLKQVQEQIGDVRPAFANVMAHCWTMNSVKSAKENFVDKMGKDMILVTPSQLAELYKQAKEKGWTEPNQGEKKDSKEPATHKPGKYIS